MLITKRMPNNNEENFNDKDINLKKTIYILLLIMVCSGFFGFVYETIFYRIDLGYFVKRGSTFGPWIPIYSFGGLLITILTYRFKKSPVIIFLSNCLITGVLEYATGYVLDKLFNTRLWDYNTEIWNWGNVNGYICFRSIFFFGLSSLILIYIIIPILKKLVLRISEKKIAIISCSLGSLFFIDMILHGIVNIIANN